MYILLLYLVVLLLGSGSVAARFWLCTKGGLGRLFFLFFFLYVLCVPYALAKACVVCMVL